MKMDSSMCLICQLDTTEPLKCPLNKKGALNKAAPYSSFLDSVNSFRALGMLPVALNFQEDITVDELVENQAV